MIAIKLPTPLLNGCNTCAFQDDTLNIASAIYSYDDAAKQTIYQISTTESKFNKYTMLFGLQAFQDENEAVFQIANTRRRFTGRNVYIKFQENGEWREYKVKNYIQQLDPGFARKENYVIFTRQGTSYCRYNRFFDAFCPKALINTAKSIKPNQVCLYHFPTDTLKLFTIKGEPKLCAIGNHVAAAVTGRNAYFFDLD